MSTHTSPQRDELAFIPRPMDRIADAADGPASDWLWHGLIGRGNLTLFTSQWKAGKTTLLTGLLQQFAKAGTFLDLAVSPAKVLVVSEESNETWADRLQRMPVAGHCQLLSRPFRRRPTPALWNELVDRALNMQANGELDLLVIDPLARFLPGSSDSDLNAIMAMFDPMRPFMEAGGAVTILHHPRKKRSEEGSTARGTGGLLAAVDIIVELSSFGNLRCDERRRKLFAVSRFPDTPKRLVYEWDPATGKFQGLGDPLGVRFRENWSVLHAILKKRTQAATHRELLMDWPEGQEIPSASTLYTWLNRAFEEKKVRREGSGRQRDPYRYRLRNEDDDYRDRGELPPVRLIFGD
jgi:hypothetical protein